MYVSHKREMKFNMRINCIFYRLGGAYKAANIPYYIVT